MRKLEAGRERYFPVMAALMDMKMPGDGSPARIEEPSMMRIVLELIDIGYLDQDAFVIKKKFSEIRGLYFRGGNPFTGKGWAEFNRNYRIRRNGMRRRLLILLLLLVLCAAVFMIMRLV